jgi:hypothetical protein
MGEGSLRKKLIAKKSPHPSVLVETPSRPLPQGERANARKCPEDAIAASADPVERVGIVEE